MTKYFVSRHAGAKAWAIRNDIQARFVEHFDVGLVKKGDEVLGSLPVHRVAQVCERGGRFFHLLISVPEEYRGKELSADDMESLGAKLVEYEVRRV